MDRSRNRSSSATDRISKLPCNLIDHILKYLPLRDAVRTSILSKEWRYKWITIPYLVFDENFKEELLEKYDIETIVYQVFLLHKGPIVKFDFMFDDDFNNCRPMVDHWLHFLSNHSVQELIFWFPDKAIHETMPCHLFSFDKLTHLVLVNCKLRPPSEFQGFAKLVNLDLINVLIEPGELRRFISKCPMLGHLALYNMDCNTFGDLEIDAPNLKSFYYDFSDRFPSICIGSSLLLEEVAICVSRCTSLETSQRSQRNLIEFLGQLSSIKRLELNCDSIIDGFSCAAGLIKSFPNLQRLKITDVIESFTTHDGDEKPAVEFLKEPENCKFTLSHIEYIEINTFSGSEPQMEFVKLILSAATALVTLVLKLDPCLKNAAKEESQMLKKLARFRRASSEAEIIIT